MSRVLDVNVSLADIKALALSLCESVGSVRALTVYLLIKNNEWEQYLDLELDPTFYAHPSDFADDYLVTEFLSKAQFLPIDVDRKAVAMKKFADAEIQCKETNARLVKRQPNRRVLECFEYAKRLIDFTLGTPDYAFIAESCGWGPGTTSSCKGNFLSMYEKMSSRLDATPAMATWGLPLVTGVPRWAEQHPLCCYVSFNRVTTVPKNAKTDRLIAIEPTLNAFLQKGIGKAIRRQLYRAGVNLNDQSRNQDLAREGSITGKWATIDFSSASDTISRELIDWLLPHSWKSLFDIARSPAYLVEGRVATYHKHSSMGNGYTFELESLIFWALGRACLRSMNLPKDEISVYGDDVILPAQAFDFFQEVCTYAGFTFNTRKSFANGPFRESCGADFFLGTNVRPFYIKKLPRSVPDLYVLANKIRRYGHRRNIGLGCDSRFFDCWKAVYLLVPRGERRRGPDGYGDGHIIGSFDECAHHIISPGKRRRHFEARLGFEYLRFKPYERDRDRIHGVSVALAAQRTPYSDLDLSKSTARDKGRWVRSIGYVSSWPDLTWH